MSWPESPPRTAPQRQRPGAAGIRRPGGRCLLLYCLAATLQQEKQRSGLTAMTPKQWSEHIAQQMSPLQAVQEQVTSKCSQTKATSPASQNLMPPKTGVLLNNLSPGIMPFTRHQSPNGMGMISSTLKKQQGIFNCSHQYHIMSSSGHSPLDSLGSVCQHLQSPKANSPGVPLSKFHPRPPTSQALSLHQRRLPNVARTPTVFNSATWVVAAVSETTVVSNVDNSTHQPVGSNSIFAKAPVSVPPHAPTFPLQQTVIQPNQVAPSGRPGQKVSSALANASFGLLGNHNLQQSPVQGPVPVLSTPTAPQPGTAHSAPMSPIQAIEPPSYMATIMATTAAASAIAASHSLGPYNRMDPAPELLPDNFPLQDQPPVNGSTLPPDCNEVDLMETLMKDPSVGTNEDWMCDLKLIDDILEQHYAAQNARGQNAGQLTQGSGEP
ncbi:mastermind-like domain-containing protein 1 [Dipodomys spectabilis]|uniref:mastermind-like domain-containing protein 1 n=1 Tax=Dipodomys spectabilis TaxID=105255 RepID=UPI001C547A98|nr:mastermind-like domain-containing protein 1 [Dipodomys spectabilis]